MVLFPAFYQKAGSKDRAGWLVLLKAYLNAHSVTYGDRSNRNKTVLNTLLRCVSAYVLYLASDYVRYR